MNRRRKIITGIFSAPAFTFTVRTDNTGSSNDNQFNVPTIISGSYDCVVDWGDGSTPSVITQWNDAAWVHTFSGGAGEYTIRIRGEFTGFRFDNGGDKLKITNISSWGAMQPGANAAFYGCSNLTITASDNLNLGALTSLENFFRGCSSITTIPSIDSWDVSSITSAISLFNGASSFNSNFSSWNTSSLANITLMMNGATSFNQDIGGLDTSSVSFAAGAFNGATSFNQNLGGWDVESLTTAAGFLNGVTLSTANYDALLIGWAPQSLNNGVVFSAGNSTYTSGGAANAARNILVNTYSWSVTDGGTA